MSRQVLLEGASQRRARRMRQCAILMGRPLARRRCRYLRTATRRCFHPRPTRSGCPSRSPGDVCQAYRLVGVSGRWVRRGELRNGDLSLTWHVGGSVHPGVGRVRHLVCTAVGSASGTCEDTRAIEVEVARTPGSRRSRSLRARPSDLRPFGVVFRGRVRGVGTPGTKLYRTHIGRATSAAGVRGATPEPHAHR